MPKILAIAVCPTGTAHAAMAAAALKEQGRLLGWDVDAVSLAAGQEDRIDDERLAAADAVVLAADAAFDEGRLAGKPVHLLSTASAIRDPAGALHAARALTAPETPPRPTSPAAAASAPAPAAAAGGRKRLVAVTACPTGIAHTFMAAEALKKQATAQGFEIAVETQGSVGAQNKLTDRQIAEADAVIIAADTAVDPSRFAGKPIHYTDTGSALKRPGEVIAAALQAAPADGAPPSGAAAAAGGAGYVDEVQRAKAERSAQRSGPYKHLLTGVSYMLPIVVAGGLAIALSFVWGIEAFKQEGTLPAALMEIGGGAAFALMVPILAGFIAYSIADRPGLAPGLIGGMLASQLGAGFLGGIIAGFIAGYTAQFIRDKVRLPQNLEGLMPVLVIPLLASLVTGLLMIYVVGGPAKWLMDGLTAWLQGLSGSNAVLLGVLLGGMMAFDMGGPVNKAAYTFAVGLLGSDTFAPMAAVMAAGMTPPLGLAIASFIAKNKFNAQEREAGKPALVLGLCFITEGAIPFAAKDPLRVIPSIMFGSAITGALSMYFGCTLRAPHGGVFVLGIPNAVGNLGGYVLAILVGTAVTAATLAVVKRRAVDEAAPAAA